MLITNITCAMAGCCQGFRASHRLRRPSAPYRLRTPRAAACCALRLQHPASIAALPPRW